ncbi:hypothetical protein NP493_368g01017 [Ridgeia piscesae]|uniref:Uncharacterized protein n=1 Tax=Ridgeia piscesae TaxID=27915 RepID=A0AAD9L2X5_RIDPI|nr:hypothetical protein NP493_368g01017 [Ridgeia piscesae]
MSVHNICTLHTDVVFGSIVLPINSIQTNKQTMEDYTFQKILANRRNHGGQRGDIADDQKAPTIGGPSTCGWSHQADGLQCRSPHAGRPTMQQPSWPLQHKL